MHDGSTVECFLFKVDICASIKTKTHKAMFAFTKGNESTFLGAKSTGIGCSCETGNWICSHVYLFLLLAMKFQSRYVALDIDALMVKFPCQLKLMSSLFIPVSLFYHPQKLLI